MKKTQKIFFSSTHCPCPSGKTSWSISSLWRQLGMPSHSVELLSFLPFLHFFRRIHLARRKKIICLLRMGLQTKSLAPERHMLPTLSSQYLRGSLYPREEFFFSKTKKKLLARTSSCSQGLIRPNLLLITKFHNKYL